MIEKNRYDSCSICTLIFVSGGKGGCRACHMHLCQLRSPRGGRLDIFCFCLSFRRVYFWARKRQEKLDTQIRASPVVHERQAMLRALEAVHGQLNDSECPSSDYLSLKAEETECNEPTAAPLDEILSKQASSNSQIQLWTIQATSGSPGPRPRQRCRCQRRNTER